MERLTKRFDSVVCYVGAYKMNDEDIPAEVTDSGVREILERLAEYEDRGIDPTEVRLVQETLVTAQRLNKEYYLEMEKYLKAEAEGRLLILPCKFGTPVFVIRHEVDVDKIPDDFKAFMFGTPVVSQEVFGPWLLLYPGEIYLDREDAEAALKGEANGKV